VVDENMLQTLLARGMFVDAAEARAAGGARETATAPKEGFFGRWRLSGSRLNTLLTAPPPQLGASIDEVVGVLSSLADRYPDKVLFQILRHDRSRLNAYGVTHSLHCAAVCCLSARRLGWSDAERRTLVSAALTMNVSMIELQGRLAVQCTPVTADQRTQIESHPKKSVEMLEAAGIAEADWLGAVLQHHERADGLGYPGGLSEVGQLARALQYADVFTAKLSARSTRAPLPPDRAARDLFQRTGGHPLAAALVKEFGIYPPGCFVRLASGEIAIVVHRGETVNTPVVACLTKANGQPMMRPIRRETTARDSSVVSIVPETDVMVRVSWESLYSDD
jgi:hypothetical protein